MKTIKFGARGRLTETFLSLPAGTLTDPAAVTLKLRSPAGVETSYTLAGGDVIRDSVGVYYYDQTFTISGQWLARWTAGGTLIATDEYVFRVESTTFVSP